MARLPARTHPTDTEVSFVLPQISSRDRVRRTFARVAPAVAVTGLAIALAPGVAQAANECPNSEIAARVFQDYDGDANSYFAAPGGVFERYGYGSDSTAARTGATSLVPRAHSYEEAGTTALSMATGSTVTT